jgi:hypothetical protein
MILGRAIALEPTAEQAPHFCRVCGTKRYAFNWGWAEWKRMREAGESPRSTSRRVLEQRCGKHSGNAAAVAVRVPRSGAAHTEGPRFRGCMTAVPSLLDGDRWGRNRNSCGRNDMICDQKHAIVLKGRRIPVCCPEINPI